MNPAAFLADVLAAPEHLDALARAYREPGGPLEAVAAAPPERIVLTGLGSSRYAALAVAPRLRERGLAAVAERSTTTLTSPPPAGSLLVAVSASGATEETVEAAARHPGTVVAVTNKPESPLAETADAVLPLLSGEERGGVACRTFQATLAALGLLGHRLAGLRECGPDAVARAAEASRATLDSRGAWLEEAVALLAAGGPIHAIAPAARISTAEQSALMLREGPRLPAGAAETGDWLHVDVYLTVWPEYRALLFTGAPHDAAVLDWVRRRRGALIAVGERLPEADLQIDLAGADEPWVRTLVETHVAELVAGELWLRGLGRAPRD